jgi:hypothetical protein
VCANGGDECLGAPSGADAQRQAVAALVGLSPGEEEVLVLKSPRSGELDDKRIAGGRTQRIRSRYQAPW